ncbi:MAG: fasciclin domain-containing protein [bacterium]|nr:fasciclin domain-containing protein [bacterium]
MVNSREDLSVLASVVAAVDPSIAETLTRTDIPGLTLLAPNNEAFTRLGLYFDVDLAFFVENPEVTANLLRYHVLTGFFSLADIAVNNGGVILTALPDTSIRVAVTESGGVRLNIADVVESDVRASNGRIQVLDDVIFTGALEEEIVAAIAEWKAVQEEIANLPADSVVGLVRDNADLSILFDVIFAAEQYELLRDGFPFTVFAPTNAAFEALFAALGVTADEALENTELLKTVLRYHILEDELDAADLVAAAGTTIETLDGEGIVVTATEEGGVVLNGAVNVVTADVVGFNVTVHVVDAVLVPPSYTLSQKKAAVLVDVPERSVLGRLIADERFSTLVDLLVATDSVGALPAGGFTVFAPTNGAFNDAFEALGVSKEQVLLDPSLVSGLLVYHVVPTLARAEDVVALDGQTVATADGDLILVEVDDEGGVLLNGVANVIETDITGTNGVIHAIDAVLTPLVATRTAAREALATSAPADSIAFLAATNPDFSILADVIIATGQDTLLSNGFPFTVFAPTNAAFETLLTEMGTNLDAALLNNAEMLTEVLRYHVLEDQIASADVEDGAIVETLQGDLMTFSVADGVVMVNGVATVTTADVAAANGVVHIIDVVLTPPSVALANAREEQLAELKEGSIVSLAVADEQFSTLVDVIVLTGSTALLDQGFPFTVFAPTNDAFDALFDALGVSQAEAYLNTDLLKTVLRYHVLEDAVMSADIEDGAEVESLQGGVLTFTVDGDVVMVNDATVVAADIEAVNGVVHVIDTVLVPEE